MIRGDIKLTIELGVDALHTGKAIRPDPTPSEAIGMAVDGGAGFPHRPATNAPTMI